MKSCIKIVILASIFLSGCYNTGALTITGCEPRRIMINPLETGNTDVAITWRSSLEVEEGFVQWGLAEPNPITDISRFSKQEARVRTDTVSYKGSTSIVKSFRRQLRDLDPGEKYLYRVGNDKDGWSEWIQFDLPAAHPDSAFTFVYL